MTNLTHATLTLIDTASGERRMLVAHTTKDGIFLSVSSSESVTSLSKRFAMDVEGAVAALFRDYEKLRNTPGKLVWILADYVASKVSEAQQVDPDDAPWLAGAENEESGRLMRLDAGWWYKYRVIRRTEPPRADGLYALQVSTYAGDPSDAVCTSTSTTFFQSKDAAIARITWLPMTCSAR